MTGGNKFDRAVNVRFGTGSETVTGDINLENSQGKEVAENKASEKKTKTDGSKRQIKTNENNGLAGGVTDMKKKAKASGNIPDAEMETFEVEQVKSQTKIIIQKEGEKENEERKPEEKKFKRVDNIEDILPQGNLTFEIIHNTIVEYLEYLLELENPTGFGEKANRAKNINFTDKFAGKTLALRPIIHNYIDYISSKTPYSKTEVLDKILINGIRITSFDK